jgi:Family of unknown function (DUF5681)
MTKFQAGKSGNPAGRPKGTKDKRTALRDLLTPHSEDLVNTLVHFAKVGDMSAMRIVMERLLPPLREEPICVAVPNIQGPKDCIDAQAAVLGAVASGELLPREGEVLTGLIEAQRRAYETGELADRLRNVEALLEAKGGKA